MRHYIGRRGGFEPTAPCGSPIAKFMELELSVGVGCLEGSMSMLLP
jgi:hypothetical protein